MNSTPSSSLNAITERALVLGGAGSAGNAWVIGVVAGLCDAGVQVTAADLIVGTSSGSTTAAQITSANPAELLASILAAPAQTPTARVGSGVADGRTRPVTSQLEATAAIIASAEDAADMRRRMGAWALERAAASEQSWRTRWRATVAGRLPRQQWPEQRMLITAVDAQSGVPVVFDRCSGVDLADAVAASCSSGVAYRIGDGHYIDGGYRRNENADLAAGSGRALVLSPFGGRTRHPLDWGMQLSSQVDELRAGGSLVETVFPDEHSRNAFGDNVMDPTTRSPAARAGYEQGRALAEPLADFWR